MAGHLAREDAAHLMRGASAFVFPSLYEGFGLPVLEAMSAGVPVVSSCASSLPEVGGDAVRYVDPESEESMAEALVELEEDAGLREDLARRGRARAHGFSWARTARETLAFYRELVGARC
jgi:glycosyltransferase involved in cell wall biosynthesis